MNAEERTRFMLHRLSKANKRIDFEWLDPKHENILKILKKLADEKDYKMKSLEWLCNSFNGKTADQYVDSGINIIKLRNVTGEGIDWNTDYVLKDFYESNPEIRVKIDDILVTCTGDGTIGRVDILQKGRPCIVAVDVCVLRGKNSKEILPKYIVHFLRSVFGQMQMKRYTVGSTGQTHLRDIDKIRVVYPKEIEVQKKIVEASERHLSSALQHKRDYTKHLREARIELPSDLTSLRSSKFYIARTHPSLRRIDFEYLDPRHERMNKTMKQLSKEKGYRLDKVGELCDIFRGKGTSPYVSSGIPIIKVRNITGEGIDWNTDFVLRDFYESKPEIQLQINDVLITSTGEGTIGRVDIFDKDFPCITDGHVTTLRVKENSLILPHFLAYSLRSVFGQMQMKRYTVGSTGQTELNETDIKKIKLLFPISEEEQKTLISEAQEHEEKAIESKKAYKNGLKSAKTEFLRFLNIK